MNKQNHHEISRNGKPFSNMNIALVIVTVAIISIYIGIGTTGQWVPTGWILTALVSVLVTWCVYGISRWVIAIAYKQLQVENSRLKDELVQANKQFADEKIRHSNQLATARKEAGSYRELVNILNDLVPVLEKFEDVLRDVGADQEAVNDSMKDLEESHRVAYSVAKAIYDHLGCTTVLPDTTDDISTNSAEIPTEEENSAEDSSEES